MNRHEEDDNSRESLLEQARYRIAAGEAPGRIAYHLERIAPGLGQALLRSNNNRLAPGPSFSANRPYAPMAVNRGKVQTSATLATAGACPPVPSPGLGRAELNRRLRATEQHFKERSADAFSVPDFDNRIELFMKSMPGARNDTKSKNSSSFVRGSAQFGNFLFGAEAAAAGLGLQEALDWGSGAQVGQDISKNKIPTGTDRPEDIEAIKSGYKYYKDGCVK